MVVVVVVMVALGPTTHHRWRAHVFVQSVQPRIFRVCCTSMD